MEATYIRVCGRECTNANVEQPTDTQLLRKRKSRVTAWITCKRLMAPNP